MKHTQHRSLLLTVLSYLQVIVMVAAAGVSCAAVLLVSGYACLTLTYGEDDRDVFHHHDSPHVVCMHARTHTHTGVTNKTIVQGSQCQSRSLSLGSAWH